MVCGAKSLWSLERGAAVFWTARTEQEIEDAAKEIRDEGGNAIAVAADVTDFRAMESVMRAAVDAFGGIGRQRGR